MLSNVLATTTNYALRSHDGTALVCIDGAPLAAGMSREVYALPSDPRLIVKVRKSEPPPRRFFRRWKILSTVRRYYKQVVPLLREIREYRRVASEGPRTEKHLQRYEGLVRTERGLGLVVEAVRRPDGSLGMTLRSLISAGRYDKHSDQAVEEFLDWFVSSSLVAADVHLDNIVFDERRQAMVLVDGIGDKTFLPVRAWFPWLNRRYKRRCAMAIKSDVTRWFMKVAMNRPAAAVLCIVGLSLGIDMMDGHLIDG